MNPAQARPVRRGNAVDADPDQPIPPRFRWLKRIALASAVFLLLVGGLRLWWGIHASRALQAEIARLQAAGEPLFPEEFDPPYVRDEDNAALLYLQAIDAWRQAGELRLDPAEWPDDTEYTAAAREAFEANAAALSLVRQARSLPAADWGLRLRRPVVGALLPSLSDHRALARLLVGLAQYHHHLGDDAAAVEFILDALDLGERIDQHPTLISHLVAIAVGSLSAQGIERILPGFVSVTPHDDARTASRKQVDLLIQALLDEQGMQMGLLQSFRCERMWQLETVSIVQSGGGLFWALSGGAMGGPAPASPGERMFIRLIAPALYLDGVWMLRHTTAQIEALQESNWPSVRERLPVTEQPAGLAQLTLVRIWHSSFERPIVLHFRGVAARRMAATALAVRLYELDRGRPPTALQELLPAYLPALPADPFAPDGRPFGYWPDAERPLLYSVNVAGVETLPKVVLQPDGALDLDAGIQPFYLDGPAPQARTAPPPEEEIEDADEAELSDFTATQPRQ